LYYYGIKQADERDSPEHLPIDKHCAEKLKSLRLVCEMDAMELSGESG
jgi:hypothetical protein